MARVFLAKVVGEPAMPSPFPGMNPYLEQEDAWHDFHERAIPLAADLLGTQVLPRYFVKIDEHVYIHELEEESRRLMGRADLAMVKARTPGDQASATGLLEAPAVVRQPTVDVERLSFLEIRDRQNRQLITAIELLSPSNKRLGSDRDQYLTKQTTLLSSTANLVEIDLLRGGPRMPWLDMPPCDYCIIVSRVEERPHAGIWPIQLRQRLPIIPVPLRSGEPNAVLDLQQIVNRVYDAAGYEFYIYMSDPEPPLSPEEAGWAREFLPHPS
jgi:hypothetical protein